MAYNPATMYIPHSSSTIQLYGHPYHSTVNRYLLVILILMIGGMIIMASQGRWLPFYGMMGGAIIVIMYSAYSTRRQYKRKRER